VWKSFVLEESWRDCCRVFLRLVKSTECGVTNDTAERRRSNCQRFRRPSVEEQGAATPEISRKQAAQGTQQVSSSITDAQHGASESESASSQVLSAARSLSSDSIR
jgi:hypothetical protein